MRQRIDEILTLKKSNSETYPEKIKLGDVNKFFSAIKPVLTDNSWTYYGRI